MQKITIGNIGIFGLGRERCSLRCSLLLLEYEEKMNDSRKISINVVGQKPPYVGNRVSRSG